MYWKKILSVFIAITVYNMSFGQEKKSPISIGAKVMGEANSRTGSTRPFTGIQFIYTTSKYSGFESGLYYRTLRNEFLVQIFNPSNNSTTQNNFIVSERYVSIPLLYRFQSKFINFTAGGSMDLFFDWADKSSSGSVDSYNRSNNVLFGVVGGVSKTIHFDSHWKLEPEIRFNPVLSDGDPYLNSAFGFSVRYQW
jgi:hypothetical protein